MMHRVSDSHKLTVIRTRIGILAVLLSLILSLLATQPIFAEGQSASTYVTTLKVNEVHQITGASVSIDTASKSRLAKLYYKDFAPYAQVYRFNVVPGTHYTLVTEFPGDGKYANLEVIGANPLSTKLDAKAPTGSLANILAFTGSADRVSPGFTFRTNFTVSKESTTTYLYVIGHFESPEASLKIKLQSPALSDSEVEKSLDNGLTWGTYHTDPIRLFNLEASVPGATPLKTVVFTLGQATASFNGKVEALELPPYKNGTRTMVPLRYIGDKLGAQVVYSQATKQVTYTTNTVTLVLWLGKAQALVNGTSLVLEAPPESVKGRLAVPLRFIGENLGASVIFDAKTQRITILQY